MTFLERGHGETVKGAVHAALGGLALACAAYNLAAYRQRPADHLARNVVIYAALVGLETVHVAHHWAARA